MRRLLLLPALAAAALVAACPSFDENGRYACTTDDDCRSAVGERCVDGACAVPLEPCGNGRCEPDECTACPADCVFADCSAGGCNGDGSCDPDETCFTCPQDCVEDACGRCGDEATCEPTECDLGCGECSGDPICVPDSCGPDHPGNEVDCMDGLDEDCDGSTDCGDSDCFGPACAEDCSSPGDEDGDQLEECQDPDCAPCVEGEDCWNQGDEDGDGLFDCADGDCLGTGACPDVCGDELCVPALECAACVDCAGHETCGQLIEDCSNGRDDDFDGRTDCADPGCASVADCGTEAACGVGAEDLDGDGFAGCDDLDCWDSGECTTAATEDCGNGRDDDGNAGGDANSDCQDTACVQLSGCAISCGSNPVTTALPEGTDPSAPALRLRAVTAPVPLEVACEDVTAPSTFVLSWKVPADGAYRFDTRGSSVRNVLSVTRETSCPNSVGCDLSSEDGTGSVEDLGLTGGETVLILLAPLDATDLSQLWLWIERVN